MTGKFKKKNYDTLNQWWESGKIHFKIIVIKFSTKKNKKIKQKLTNLTHAILREKTKTKPNETKIKNWQKKIDDIENYRKQGTIIRSKETQIANEEILNKFFFQQEQQKQSKKQITQLQNNKNQLLTSNSKVLKESQKYYQSLNEKQNNCKTTREQLLKKIPKTVNIDQNDQLTKKMEKKRTETSNKPNGRG